MTEKQREAFARSDARRAAQGLPPARPADASPKRPPMRGLGDAVKRVTDALHIPQCGGCKRRQATLNRLVPFGEKSPDDELTAGQSGAIISKAGITPKQEADG